MREAQIEKTVCDYARSKGCLVVKNATPGHRGIPDRLFIYDGACLFIEFKALGKKPTPLQEKWLRDLQGHGVGAEWTDNVLQGKLMIDQLVMKDV